MDKFGIWPAYFDPSKIKKSVSKMSRRCLENKADAFISILFKMWRKPLLFKPLLFKEFPKCKTTQEKFDLVEQNKENKSTSILIECFFSRVKAGIFCSLLCAKTVGHLLVYSLFMMCAIWQK